LSGAEGAWFSAEARTVWLVLVHKRLEVIRAFWYRMQLYFL